MSRYMTLQKEALCVGANLFLLNLLSLAVRRSSPEQAKDDNG